MVEHKTRGLGTVKVDACTHAHKHAVRAHAHGRACAYVCMHEHACTHMCTCMPVCADTCPLYVDALVYGHMCILIPVWRADVRMHASTHRDRTVVHMPIALSGSVRRSDSSSVHRTLLMTGLCWGQLLIIEFVRNWKARRNCGGVSFHSLTAASSHDPETSAVSQAVLLEEGLPQSPPTFVRECGRGSIEMQEFRRTPDLSAEKGQDGLASRSKCSSAGNRQVGRE